MALKNRDVFAIDPSTSIIPNSGVAKVQSPESDGDWKKLEWELRSFVCEGQFEKGLERILDSYLSNLDQAEQPAVWVYGFYGSGKSHLMRVLEYLWRDYPLPSGSSARDLTALTEDIDDHLVELSSAARRFGGLWSAAGELGHGADGSFRLAFLSVIFNAAGLPHRYPLARFVIYLKENDLFDAVHAHVESAGEKFEDELRELYVSDVLAEALIAAGATFGETPSAISATLQAQFPHVDDISNDDALDTFEQVLKLQSTKKGELPLTLVVLDEMKEYIREDEGRASNVRQLAESCSSRFGSRVLVVATGQDALTSNPTLQKLEDRFLIDVALSDTDVETVIRKVVLRKKPDAVDAIEQALEQVSGEIDRHLGGTKLEAKAADKSTWAADYPILPTRRRFWERVLRALDRAGKEGVLRSQLKIVHEAARQAADKPLGTVVGADFLFTYEAPAMRSNGVLLREIYELISGLRQDGTHDGELKSRVCALIFLISQLPHDDFGNSDAGVRATAGVIADLLIEDLSKDGAELRREVPRLLGELVQQGLVMQLGDEFRLQTEEGSEWTQDFNQRRAAIRDDVAKISQFRSERLANAVDDALSGVKLAHGSSKTPRRFKRHWNDEEPDVSGTDIPLWIGDEWNVADGKAKQAAAKAGTESPIVFVLLPKIGAEAIRDALAEWAAANETISRRPEPQTDEGKQARQSMRSRLDDVEQRLDEMFETVITNAQVMQGGGTALTTSSMRSGIEAAGRNALSRMFPEFNAGDDPNWGKVVSKAHDGAPDALTSVKWNGDVTENPVCKAVLAHTRGAGTNGSDIQRHFKAPPYGWPEDAVNGALLALLVSGHLRAARGIQKVSSAKDLPPSQVGKHTFFKENEPPSTGERLQVRGLLARANISFEQGQEAAEISGLLKQLRQLAFATGGPAPLPDPPDTSNLEELEALAGNEQFREIAKQHEQLLDNIEEWTAAGAQREAREATWATLTRLLEHADDLEEKDDVQAQYDAILNSRLLLHDPDPITPLVDQIGDALRAAVTTSLEEARNTYDQELKALQDEEGWQQLSDDQRKEVLSESKLAQPAEADTSSNEMLLRELNLRSLKGLQDLVDLMPVKAQAARRAVAEIIDPEPTVREVKPPTATLKTEADVEDYLAELRVNLMKHIDAGDTVIT